MSTTVPASLPLDLQLQERSLQPLGRVKFNECYGDNLYEKVNRTLALPSPNVEHDRLKLEALAQMEQWLHHPECVVRALNAGLFTELLLNASNENVAIRVASTHSLVQLVASRSGREFAIQAQILPRLTKLSASDTETEAAVRRNVLRIYSALAESPSGIDHLRLGGMFDILIEKVDSENCDACRSLCLETLSKCVRNLEGWKQCVRSDEIVPRIAKVMERTLADPSTTQTSQQVTAAQGKLRESLEPRMNVLANLCQTVANIAAFSPPGSGLGTEGKDVCVKADLVRMITSLLPHPLRSIRLQASLALSHLTNTLSGKVAALECQAIQPLIDAACADRRGEDVGLVALEEEEVVAAQSMQALINVAEHPKAKSDPRVQVAAGKLKIIAADQSRKEMVRHAAQMAVDQITWEP